MAKEKYENPTLGDTVRLRLYVYNSNAMTSVKVFRSIAIYLLDPFNKSEQNIDGRTLITQIATTTITQQSVGNYYVDLVLNSSDDFVLGDYIIQWNLIFENDPDCPSIIEDKFTIYSRNWATSDLPLIHSFDFKFSPNRFVKNSKQYLIVKIIPKAQNADTLSRYYANMAVSSGLTVSISERCGPCNNVDEDDFILENEPVEIRERGTGYVLLDMREDNDLGLECGLYNIFFTLEFGNTVHVSPVSQFEIY